MDDRLSIGVAPLYAVVESVMRGVVGGGIAEIDKTDYGF